MSPCTSAPISYLKLERYQLRELRAVEADAIDQHLAACPACRACLVQVQREVVLPPLPELPQLRSQQSVPAKATQLSPWRALVEWAQAAAAWLAHAPGRAALVTASLAAAALLVVTRTLGPGHEPPEFPSARIAVKGGDLAIELVRKHGDGLAEASRFAPGDAFKVLITCASTSAVHVEVVVYQGTQASFPLASQTIEHCGNRIDLKGAFALDGDESAQVCAVIAEHPAPRAALEQGPNALTKHGTAVCERVDPAR